MVLVYAVTVFRDVIKRICTRNCTVSAVIVLVVLRRTSGILSGKRLCLCCNDQILLLAHQSEFAVVPVQLVVVGEYGNRIAVRQCIQMQLIPSQIPLAVYFCIGGNAFEVILSIGICHCLHCDCCLFPGSSIQIILVQCQVEIAAAAFVQIHRAVIIEVIPDSSVHCRSLNRFQSAVVYAVGIHRSDNIIIDIVVLPYIVTVESRFNAANAMRRLLCQQDILVRLVKVYRLTCIRFLRCCQQVTVDAVSCGIQHLVLGHRIAIRHGIQPQTVACQIHLSVNRHKGRLVRELIFTCGYICLNGICLDKLPLSGVVQIILVEIYGLLCRHCRFTGFLQAAVVLVEPDSALNLSGLERFQTTVVNVDHVRIQNGIVFLICDRIRQIRGSMAL